MFEYAGKIPVSLCVGNSKTFSNIVYKNQKQHMRLVEGTLRDDFIELEPRFFFFFFQVAVIANSKSATWGVFGAAKNIYISAHHFYIAN